MEKSKTLVTAGIVSYGAAEEVVKAANSITEHTKDVNLRLMILDNASPDGTTEQLKNTTFAKNVFLKCSSKNVGFGKAHNLIFHMLNKTTKSKYHAVINPDIVLENDTISQICAWLDQHPDVVMVTPQLRFPDGSLQQTPKRFPSLLALTARQLRLPFLKKVEQHYLMLDHDLSKPTDVEFCSGCFFVIRSDIYAKMGGFDPRYFVYVEDADITRKALKYGRAVYYPDAWVYHAWHRDANKKWKNFFMQINSMLQYWHKWGFKWI